MSTPTTPTRQGNKERAKRTQKKSKSGGSLTLAPETFMQEVALKCEREVTAQERADVLAAIEEKTVSLSPERWDESVAIIAVRLRQKEEAAHPPVEKWTKNASELGTNISAKIGTFAAMQPQIEQVQKDFSALKKAIEDGKLPPDTRIMRQTVWEKTHKKDGSKTTERGFLHFEDYCMVVLKRTKQAVYAMLADCDPPAEPKPPETDPEKVKGALLKRGTATLLNLFQAWQPHEKTLTFASLLQRIENAVRAKYAGELNRVRERARDDAAKLAALEAIAGGVNNTTAKRAVERETLPPPQGHAG